MKFGSLTSFILVAYTLFMEVGCAQSPPTATICDGSIDNPCLVRDKENIDEKTKHYRDTQMLSLAYHGNTAGLDTLWMSGSSVPTQHDFVNMLKIIKSKTGNNLKQVIDLDLRQESHGYLNNAPITLTAEKDWVNINKTHHQVLADEAAWLHQIALKQSVVNVLSTDQFKNGDFSSGIRLPVETVESEKTLAEKSGFSYRRLTVTDHLSPDVNEVDHFVTLISTLPTGTWVHMHCRGGKGRTTTFLAMYDMLQNSDKATFNDIIERQAAVDPFYNLLDIDPEDGGKIQGFQDRLTFLKDFYAFTIDKRKGYKKNWSTWLVEHHIIYPTRH